MEKKPTINAPILGKSLSLLKMTGDDSCQPKHTFLSQSIITIFTTTGIHSFKRYPTLSPTIFYCVFFLIYYKKITHNSPKEP